MNKIQYYKRFDIYRVSAKSELIVPNRKYFFICKTFYFNNFFGHNEITHEDYKSLDMAAVGVGLPDDILSSP